MFCPVACSGRELATAESKNQHISRSLPLHDGNGQGETTTVDLQAVAALNVGCSRKSSGRAQLTRRS